MSSNTPYDPNPYDHHHQGGFLSNFRSSLTQNFRESREWFSAQSMIIKTTLVVIALLLVVVCILFLIFHSYLISVLIQLSDDWRNLPYGSVLIFLLIFIVGFPPLIGFTAISLLTGMIYGFPNGWPILAAGSVLGSTVAFLVYKYLLHNQAMRLMNHSEMFRAFAEILSEDNSLVLLILIRLCPTPYSLSNGALSAIPELSLLNYFLAMLITSPKLLIHLYIGSKLKELGKGSSNKIVDVISITITGIAASLATYLIYARMRAKLASFHQRGVVSDDALLFGNFEDELEMASHNDIELNSSDFDTDNFIIGDGEEEENEALQGETSKPS
ncbi:TVP38 [Candida oxycetoniae]|uniref:Golgi apparatus membrane protein TVP38 n=1 Tax=Candida oxycetoniae TaxID=497107 RepID=A0AAI9SSU1_9ASCO|nr:TVP38 [Candida oxycetoniae]KAI3402475.2 TVP38 [Candida oxycetoniae]